MFAVSEREGPEARDEAKVRKFAAKSAMPQDSGACTEKNPKSRSALQKEALAWLQRTSVGTPSAP